MTLKAIIPSGQTELTVNGLHQWDYGQKLEIHSPDLPSIVEVHFACAGMKEAVVRVCEAADGVATAAIPDKCLEQTTPITAWVYEIDDTAGFTTKTITLPIIPRTKPQPGECTSSEGYYDAYTDLITRVNEAGENLSAAADEAVKTANAAATQSVKTVNNAATQAVNTVNTTATQAVNTVNTAANEAAESFKAGDVIVNRALTAGAADAIGVSLVATVTITDGIGDKPSEVKVNTFYLVVFEEPNATRSGVFYLKSGAEQVQECSLGDICMGWLSGDAGNYIRLGERNGTLKFYKLGGISR